MTAFSERRKEPRNQSDLSASVSVLDCGDRRLNSRILDLSDAGLAIFLPEALAFGCPLAVTYKGVLILAEVMYCVPLGNGYRAGLKVDQAMATLNAKASVAEVTRELRSDLAGLQFQEDGAASAQPLYFATAGGRS
jgi:hypothetical protein